MAEPLAYLGDEWRDEAERRLSAELDADDLKRVTTSLTNVYRSCPDGGARYVHVAYRDGRLADLRVGMGAAPPAEFRVTGDYEVFARVTRGELGSQRAIVSGLLTLEGSLWKALRLVTIADRLNRVLAGIPTRF
jgi:hypothetical protein